MHEVMRACFFFEERKRKPLKKKENASQIEMALDIDEGAVSQADCAGKASDNWLSWPLFI